MLMHRKNFYNIIRKVNKIKANFKRYKQRKIFLSIIKAVKIIQPFFRRRLVKVEFNKK